MKLDLKMEENEQAISLITDDYLTKLKKALVLIMNDLPDNRDDTVNAKLLDSIKFEIANNKQKNLIEFLNLFIQNEILDSKQFKSSITTKDPEVVQFFIDLIQIFTLETNVSATFLCKLLDFLYSYFKSNFNTQFLNESIICCSILNLIISLYDLINVPSNLIESNDYKLFNDIILDTYLFQKDSLLNHLQVDCKSIFVRKTYKKLLNKHLIYLFDQSNKERLDHIINCFSLNNMSYEVKIHNLDVYSDLIRHYFLQKTTSKSIKLNDLSQFFNFSKEKTKYLDSFNTFLNDASIEAFTFIYVYDLINQITNKTKSLNDFMIQNLNSICFHFMKLSQSSLSIDQSFKSSIYKKNIDHLFKFLIYFYSFLNEFQFNNESNSLSVTFIQNICVLLNIDTNEISNQFNAVKLTIKQILIMPLDLSSYKQMELKYQVENYLIPIADKPISLKLLFLKQCIFNLKLFIKKFQYLELFQFISSKQIIYLLRHLDIDLDTKNRLLEILIDYFKSESLLSDSFKELIDLFMDSFCLKLNDSFNDSLFKLLNIYIHSFETNNLSNKMSQIIFNHLNNCQDLDILSQQLSKLFNFLSSLLPVNYQNFQLVVRLLNENDYFVLKKSTNFLSANLETNSDNNESSDNFNEFQDSIFKFFKNLFIAFKSFNTSQLDLESVIFDEKLLKLVENNCLHQTEAFIRREYVDFLVSYQVYQFDLLVKHLNIPTAEINKSNFNIRNVINFFSNLILHDFDWQIQLYCLDYFEIILGIISKSLDTNDCLVANLLNFGSNKTSQLLTNEISDTRLKLLNFSLIEIIFCLTDFFKSIFLTLNDCDQHVVGKVAQLILSLKKNQKINLLIQNFTNTKYSEAKDCLSIDNKQIDYILKFLSESSLEKELNLKLENSCKTSDLYTRNPASILDDIISSYQFEIDDEKFIDCY